MIRQTFNTVYRFKQSSEALRPILDVEFMMAVMHYSSHWKHGFKWHIVNIVANSLTIPSTIPPNRHFTHLRRCA